MTWNFINKKCLTCGNFQDVPYNGFGRPKARHHCNTCNKTTKFGDWSDKCIREAEA